MTASKSLRQLITTLQPVRKQNECCCSTLPSLFLKKVVPIVKVGLFTLINFIQKNPPGFPQRLVCMWFLNTINLTVKINHHKYGYLESYLLSVLGWLLFEIHIHVLCQIPSQLLVAFKILLGLQATTFPEKSCVDGAQGSHSSDWSLECELLGHSAALRTLSSL